MTRRPESAPRQRCLGGVLRGSEDGRAGRAPPAKAGRVRPAGRALGAGTRGGAYPSPAVGTGCQGSSSSPVRSPRVRMSWRHLRSWLRWFSYRATMPRPSRQPRRWRCSSCGEAESPPERRFATAAARVPAARECPERPRFVSSGDNHWIKALPAQRDIDAVPTRWPDSSLGATAASSRATGRGHDGCRSRGGTKSSTRSRSATSVRRRRGRHPRP
jgi:hypothetical protein